MKQHRFWAWGAVICMIMVMVTGYKQTPTFSAIIIRHSKAFKGVRAMKQHRFWAWGAVICMIMVMVTGYKRK